MAAPERDLQISYARAPDGFALAWTRIGAGSPLVVIPGLPFASFRLEWRVAEHRYAYETLGQNLEVVLFDPRGMGDSARDVGPITLSSLVEDVRVVADAAGHRRVALMGLWHGALPAIATAAAHPDRVSHLVLYGGAARARDAMSGPQISALLSLIDQDWGLFASTAARFWQGWAEGPSNALATELLQRSTTPVVARQVLDMAATEDLTPVLGAIRARTLILARAEDGPEEAALARALASAIPAAQLSLLALPSPAIWMHEAAQTAGLITAFVTGRRGVRRDADVEPIVVRALSPREREVVALVAAGESNAEIGHRLGIQVYTVERHLGNIYRKIGARGRVDAAAYAIQHGIRPA